MRHPPALRRTAARVRPVRLLCLTVLLLASPGAFAQEETGPEPAASGGADRELPTLYLLELSVDGPEAEVRQALVEWWQSRAASRLRLAGAPVAADGGSTTAAGRADPAALRPALRLAVWQEVDHFAVRVTLTDQDGREATGGTTVFSSAPRALASALGGEILGLWVRSRGYPDAERAPPRLAALIELSALSALSKGPAPGSEPLDCAAGPGGPVLLFTDRTLGLGPRFEITPRSVRDLALRNPLPDGLIPSHVAVDPWGEPAVYGEGALLRYAPKAAAPLRSPVSGLGALDAAGLPGGGMAVLSPGRVTLFRRVDGGLHTGEISLPSPFNVALAAGPDSALWLYDLEERKIRILRAAGEGVGAFEELGSVRPLASAESLPVPQVLRVFPDGGFVLGGAGELWRFDPAGWPLWRLREFAAGVRQSLPAFYRVAVDDERAFYLLDPLSRRLLRFVDLDDGPVRADAAGAEPRFAAPPEAADVELAGLIRRWSEAGGAEGAALREACAARGLQLMSRSLFPGEAAAGAADGSVSDRALEISQARLLSELGKACAEDLLLREAEEAYNEALRILRALRAADPVDPELPERIRELERQRNGVREILVAVPPLELLPPSVSRDGDGDALSLALQLRNLSAAPARNLRYQVSIPGVPGGLLVADMPGLAGLATATLRATLAKPGPSSDPARPQGSRAPAIREDLPTRVLVLVTATMGGGEQTFWLDAPLVVPAPTLVPSHPSAP